MTLQQAKQLIPVWLEPIRVRPSGTAPIAELRLFVTGKSIESSMAIVNAQQIMAHLAADSQLKVVDLTRCKPEELDEEVFVTPSLVKYSPGPKRVVIGTLKDPIASLHALGMDVD